MTARKRDLRQRALARIRARLEAHGWPRLEMSAILTVTAGAGFLLSVALLHLGLTPMWARYPLAVLFGYAVFLLGLKIWIVLRREGGDLPLDAGADWLDLPSGGGDVPAPHFGGGGGFEGGGAGGSWGGEPQVMVVRPDGGGVAHAGASHAGASHAGGGGGHTGATHAGGGDGGGFDIGFDLDDGCAVIFLVAAVLAAALSSVYVVWVAPAFMAELLLDGALVGGLYRRARQLERRDWLVDALRRTLLPLFLTTLLFLVAGALMQHAAPGATSIGDFVAHLAR